jgi:hypothetical protein
LKVVTAAKAAVAGMDVATRVEIPEETRAAIRADRDGGIHGATGLSRRRVSTVVRIAATVARLMRAQVRRVVTVVPAMRASSRTRATVARAMRTAGIAVAIMVLNVARIAKAGVRGLPPASSAARRKASSSKRTVSKSAIRTA